MENALYEFHFAFDLVADLMLYIDVLPFIGLLLFHFKNFKQSKQVLDDTDVSSEDREYFGSMTESEEVIQLEPTVASIASNRYSMSSSPPKLSKNLLGMA